MKIKRCYGKCKKRLPINQFNKNKFQKDGLQVACKDCTKIFNAIFKKRYPEKIRKYAREAMRNTPTWKKVAYHKKWREKNRDKMRIMHATHSIVARALKVGILIKKPCKVCGDLVVHAHHDDYRKPLKVKWVCPLHHKGLKHLYFKKKRGKRFDKSLTHSI